MNLSINEKNKLVLYDIKLDKKFPRWINYIKPYTLLYEKYINNIKIKKINRINNMKEFIENIKYISKELFNKISIKPYPTGFTRSNHGGHNHMRELYLGIFLSKKKYLPEKNIFKNYIRRFIIVLATYFVAICRIDEGNFLYSKQKKFREDPNKSKFTLSDDVIDIWFPIEKNRIKKIKNYTQSIHQYYSCFFYIIIMKKIVSKKYHSLVELCGFSICYYPAIINKTEDKFILFLHYFINTPHYLDHCRGAYSLSIRDKIPQTLIYYYLIDNDLKRKKFIINLWNKMIENFYLSGEFKKPSYNIISVNINDSEDLWNFCYNYVLKREYIKDHLKKQQNLNFSKIWKDLNFNNFILKEVY